MPTCLVGLGSNVGPRQQTLDQAVERLGREPGVRLLAQSRWQRTRPVGGPPHQESFINGAVLLQTSLAPEAILAVLQRIEAEFGRRRSERWAPRTLDLDLLLYDQQVLRTASLVLPHPRMAWRRFVLEPAVEIAAEMIHPPTGWTLARLLDHLNTAVDYVAIAGPMGVGKTRLAQSLAEQAGARLISEDLDLGRLEAFYADPAGRAWDMELEFLEQRVRLLSADAAVWLKQGLVASDFWFDQSLAFAGVWLAPGRLDAFRLRWEELHRQVVRPKLIVWLDAPATQLRKNVLKRGRLGECRLQTEQLERIRQAIAGRASRPDQGPVLHLPNEEFELVLSEVLAAVEAMR